MRIEDLQKEAHKIAQEKGWHDIDRSFGDIIALCHSELSESLEEYRIGAPALTKTNYTKDIIKPTGYAVELIDCIIRIADFFEARGWDMEDILRLKMEYNKVRPYRHGGKIL